MGADISLSMTGSPRIGGNRFARLLVALREWAMSHVRLLLLTTALAASASAAFAGPCTSEIALTQARFDAKLAAAARKGPTARESIAATDSRQPTPDSIAAAEAKLGD